MASRSCFLCLFARNGHGAGGALKGCCVRQWSSLSRLDDEAPKRRLDGVLRHVRARARADSAVATSRLPGGAPQASPSFSKAHF
eukprot:15456567-Alexandrium_andersonii.AAC.2